MNVLVIEDDKRIAEVLKRGLTEDGHQVELSYRGDEGRDLIASEHYDVVVLDVMLPGMDGFSVLKHARNSSKSVPILMLTARDSMMDTVHGLNLGADDYLSKPFQLEVFLARVRAVGRRGHVPRHPQLSAGRLLLDRNSHKVYRSEEELVLTKKEFAMLELLMRRANRVVTRDQLIEAGWGYDSDVSANTMDVYMHALRSKIDGGLQPSMIRTVRSLGYLLAAAE
jgi:two-component system copper resistance phosphate regulon response regulator CusR